MKILTAISSRMRNSRKLDNLRKHAHSLISRDDRATTPIFIFGCQRSGTTMLLNVLSKSINVRQYGEGEPPYFHSKSSDARLRLVDVGTIKRLNAKEYSRHVLLKPLNESQNAKRLLDEIEGAQAIWIYRGWNAVIDSHLHRYKDWEGLDYINQICGPPGWMNERLGSKGIAELQGLIKGLTTNHDAYGLYWHVRNSLFRELADDDRVLLARYEDIVERPDIELPMLFEFLKLEYSEQFALQISRKALKKDVKYVLLAEIEQLCSATWNWLEENKRTGRV